MDDRKQAAPVAAPPAPDAEFGGDAELTSGDRRSKGRWRNLPEFGRKGKGKTLWNVCVRHSPFLLKQANVWAADKAEAQRLFLEETKNHHQKVAERERGPASRTAALAIKAAYDRAIEMTQHGKLRWEARPWEEVKAAKQSYLERITALLSRERQLAEMLAGQAPSPPLTAG